MLAGVVLDEEDEAILAEIVESVVGNEALVVVLRVVLDKGEVRILVGAVLVGVEAAKVTVAEDSETVSDESDITVAVVAGVGFPNGDELGVFDVVEGASDCVVSLLV